MSLLDTVTINCLSHIVPNRLFRPLSNSSSAVYKRFVSVGAKSFVLVGHKLLWDNLILNDSVSDFPGPTVSHCPKFLVSDYLRRLVPQIVLNYPQLIVADCFQWIFPHVTLYVKLPLALRWWSSYLVHACFGRSSTSSSNFHFYVDY